MNSIMTRSLALAALLFLMALACQPSNEPPPRPTPIPMAGLDLEYLEHTYLPTGVSGNSYVAMGSDGEVYIVGIKTGEAHQLTHDGRKKYGPVISERYVVWTEHHSPTRLPVRAPSSDIYMLDLDTGDKRLITDVPAQRSHLDIHGHRLVWRENRHQGTGYDIFSYDLESNEEIPISVRPGYQGEPAIHGDIVVWSDNRNSPLLGTVKAGCSNCPENHRDIYLYNFTTGEEREVISTGALNTSPSIHGNRLVWLKYTTEPASSSVYLLDLETGLETELGNTGERYGGQSLIYGQYVTWSIMWSCDMSSPDKPKDTGLYLYDIETGNTTKITNYVEPMALMGDGVVIVIERCFGISRLYTVFLE